MLKAASDGTEVAEMQDLSVLGGEANMFPHLACSSLQG